MGRRKITIERIKGDRNRQVTLNKRKAGLFKKAYELSVLCDCEIALVVFDCNGKRYQYASHNLEATLIRCEDGCAPTEDHNNNTLADLIERKGSKKSDEDDLDIAATQPILTVRNPTPRARAQQAEYQLVSKEFESMIREQSRTEKVRKQGAGSEQEAAKRNERRSNRTAGAMRKPYGLRVDTTSKTSLSKRRPNLKVMIPASDQKTKEIPQGIRPRTTSAVWSTAQGKGTQQQQQQEPPAPAGGVDSLVSNLPQLATPIVPGNADLAGISVAFPSPKLFSPGAMASLAHWPLSSPAVLHTGAAGDLHVSNQMQQLIQENNAFNQQQQLHEAEQQQMQMQMQQQHQQENADSSSSDDSGADSPLDLSLQKRSAEEALVSMQQQKRLCQS